MTNIRRYMNMSWGTDDYQKLIDRPLRSVELLDDGERLRFNLADGETLTYRAVGDCCSHTWIEHITVPDDIEGATVLEVKESDSVNATEEQMTEMEAKDEYVDQVTVYHTSFVTERGEIIVEYRNSSNGYYGGWLEGPEEQ